MGQFSKALDDSGIGNSLKKTISKLVGSIVSTVADQGKKNNYVFNRQLQELIEKGMPDIIENRDNRNPDTRSELSKISSFI